MEIKRLATLLNKASKILNLYEENDFTLEEVLDDIYKTLKKKSNSLIKNEYFDKNTLIKVMENMEKKDIITYLSEYKKNDLLTIANEIGIKISRGQKNEVIIESISNYYAFNNLNKDMSNRNKKISSIVDNDSHNGDGILPIDRKGM
ncbi:hypothetical protein CSBG_03083 [Clostridium sp. 7_2_43FAA]|uniref:hypothetical protein n=1 Tax=Clostridium TaxID=1485 RepID=UPI00019B08DE|nr:MULTISPECIES: hypothetical protein [Clostridium]EEH99457.1 hypothetical protein CSBG_03083 [Clostridium sp. 7_2_43FAA]